MRVWVRRIVLAELVGLLVGGLAALWNGQRVGAMLAVAAVLALGLSVSLALAMAVARLAWRGGRRAYEGLCRLVQSPRPHRTLFPRR